MIKFEHNMLVLNNFFSEDDVDQIDAYADYVRSQERERIIALLKSIDDWSGVDCEYVIKEITN
jgi:hypothetical protein